MVCWGLEVLRGAMLWLHPNLAPGLAEVQASKGLRTCITLQTPACLDLRSQTLESPQLSHLKGTKDVLHA